MKSGDVQLVKYDDRETWLSARNRSIGASESAAIFGLAPDGRESEYSLWAKKAGLIAPDVLDDEWIEWGQILEEPIAQRYSKRTGDELWTPPTPFCVAVHPRLPFLTATIDRWILTSQGRTDRGDLEIKNVGAFNSDWKQDGVVTLPLHIQAQVQHQLAVTGFSWAVVAALIGGNKLETITVERNEEFIAELEERAADFWQRVQTKTPPPVDGKEATTKALKSMHQDDNGETVELADDDATAWEILESAKEDKKLAEARIKKLDNQFRSKLGANTFGALPDGRTITLKTTERGGYYVDDTKYRTLRIQATKAKAATLKGKK